MHCYYNVIIMYTWIISVCIIWTTEFAQNVNNDTIQFISDNGAQPINGFDTYIEPTKISVEPNERKFAPAKISRYTV